MSEAWSIRPAAPEDAASVADIYAYHVRHGTATFDTEPVTAEVMRDKILSISKCGWPFLVAEHDGPALGYAYATQFRDRRAYAYTCENSIYVRADMVGQGIGRALLNALLDAAETQGFRQMIAVIGGGEPASVALHAAAGFNGAGRMRAVGRKFGRWLDTVYMQRALGSGDAELPPGEG